MTEFTKEDFEKIARLEALCAIGRAQILADPLTYLAKAEEEIYKLRQAIENAQNALQGTDEISLLQMLDPCDPKQYICIKDQAFARTKRALEHLESV